MVIQTRIAEISSILIRLLSYFFLRWALIPALPTIIFTLFVINVPSFVFSYVVEPKYDFVEEDIDITVTDTVEMDGNGENVENAEVTFQDTVIMQDRPARPWHTLLVGAPSPSRVLSLVTLLINASLVAMVADRLYSEHAITASELSFARLGFVSDTEARILVREPDQSKMPVSLEFRVKNPEPPFESPLWESAGGARWTDNSTDYTVALTATLRHKSQRVYEWRTSNGHGGEFTSGPKAGKAPELFNGSFTFVATSCMVSRVPYNPLDHALAIPGLRYLARVLPGLGAQFMMFMGDFIYIDVPRRWGTAVSDYRQKYRQVYASPDWAAAAQNLSWIHVLDDHEIENDWSANETGVYAAAMDPYRHYHMAVNPPAARRADTAWGRREGATYFSFAQGPASFFLLDTRTYRSSNSEPYDSANKTMLGAQQRADVLAYLRRPEPRGVRWKFIVSSVPFTKNWRVNRRDTWGGFLAERQVLLEAMWDAGRRGTGVVVLSGDRHEFAATQFPPPADAADRWPAGVAVHEFSASPLNQFYSPVPTYLQTDDEDVKIRYINTGNSKFGALTIRAPTDNDNGTTTSRLEYRLFIDGVQAWNTTIEAPEPAEGQTGSIWDRIKEYAS